MKNVALTAAELRDRVARFEDLLGSGAGFPDSELPGCTRALYNVVGFAPPRNAGADGVVSPVGSVNSASAPIRGDDGFNLAFVEARPGNGVILHNHDTNETFVVIHGTWRFVCNESEDVSVDLGPLDTISFPAGVPRRFESLLAHDGSPSGLMMVIVAGNEPSAVIEPEVLAEAKMTGRFTPAMS